MNDLLQLPLLSSSTVMGILVVLGYPALVLVALEVARTLGEQRQFAASILRQMAYLVLPTGAVWLTLRVLAQLPATNWAVRSAETAFALSGLYLLLRLAQAALMAVIDDQGRAPKLMLDVLRIGLSLVWGAVVVSSIWEVDLGSLFAAMGVGSIVLGFALQEFLGNLLSGLGLLSAHKFGIGDWIMVEGGPARVVEMDWRTVTLVKGDNTRIVVANSTLAKGNLTIAARADEMASITIPLSFSPDIPPEQVREAVLEAGRSLPDRTMAEGIKCMVSGITADGIDYTVVLSVPNPGVLSGPRSEFLSRFWYVAQRRGLPLAGAAEAPDAKAELEAQRCLRLLSASGAFHGDGEVISALAPSCIYQRYRRADVLRVPGSPVEAAYLVLAGGLAVSMPNGDAEVRLEVVGPGQLFVLHETLAGSLSPVQIVAEQDTDLLAIPAAALNDVMERNRVIERDVRALTDARRLAIQPLARGLRVVA